MTLYLFNIDTPGVSNCSGECAANWPPLATDGDPVAKGDAEQGFLGTAEREDGSLQVTYNDSPLYYFAGDTAAGDANGHEVGGVWFAVDTVGDAAEATMASPEPTPEPLAPTATLAPAAPPAPTATPGTPAEPPLQVLIENFELPNLSVPLGTTVRWRNADNAAHTASHGDSPTVAPSAEFRSPQLSQDGAYMHTFSQVGTFEYFCEVHPSMQATITVTEGPASAPEPTAAPQPTATPSPTATPEPTATATPAPTATPVPTATASAPAIVDSVIQSFQLQSLNVAAGTTVIWRNADGAPHTATNGNSPIVASSFEFKSPVLQQDGTYMHTFDTPGVFLYFCEIHPSMKGVITVQ